MIKLQDLAERSGKMRSHLGEAPWEAKAIAVIQCINDPEFKGRAILDAMMRAHTPFSPDMEALVELGLSLRHSRYELSLSLRHSRYELGLSLRHSRYELGLSLRHSRSLQCII